MSRIHWITLATFLSSVASFFAALDGWHDVLKIQTFAAVLGFGATAILASYGDRLNPDPGAMRRASQSVGRVVDSIAGDGT
jgi:hypothetical protein